MKSYTIIIDNDIDVIAASMKVRELARAMGMNLGDQSRISLATSTLAHALGYGDARRGKITVEQIARDARRGLQVTGQDRDGPPRDHSAPALGDVRWMMDEVDVRWLPNDYFEITMIKWIV